MKTNKPPDKQLLAYVIGLAIGDGNLSNPNGRATRLRISCNANYVELIRDIQSALQKLMSRNKVSLVMRGSNCIDVSCYSNNWESWLGWTAAGGSKFKQNVRIPPWVLQRKKYMVACLKGLFETDGCIYQDREYLMVNFVTTINNLAEDMIFMMKMLGFNAQLYIFWSKHKKKYTIRVAKNVLSFLKILRLTKK